MDTDYNTKITSYPDGSREILKLNNVRRRPMSNNHCVKRCDLEMSDDLQKKRTLNQLPAIKKKIKNLILSNDFDYFCTLTLDPKLNNSKDYSDCRQLFQSWARAIRRRTSKFDYLFVPELTPKNNYIHWHGVLSPNAEMKMNIVEAINPKTGKNVIRNGRQVYNLLDWEFGFSDLERIDNKTKVSNYITKYLSKELLCDARMLGQPRYVRSRGLLEPSVEYEQLDDSYFDNLSPSFQVKKMSEDGHIYVDKIIYKTKVTTDGEIIQEDVPEYPVEVGLGHGSMTRDEALKLYNKLNKDWR